MHCARILILQVVQLSACKKRKGKPLITLISENSALEGLINSSIFLPMEIQGDLLLFGIVLFSKES
jgi:hypothetical protein